jgi:hypothetical protein
MIHDKREIGLGARFKMSALGAARCPRLADREGVIVGRGFYNSTARVIFDGSKSPMSLHRDYIELLVQRPPCSGFLISARAIQHDVEQVDVFEPLMTESGN